MKKELPFAVSLLATGCLIWFSQSAKPVKSTDHITASNPQVFEVDSTQSPSGSNSGNRSGVGRIPAMDIPPPDFSPVQRASYQEGIPSGAVQNANTRLPGRHQYLHRDSNMESIEFLAQVAKQIANSRPISTDLTMTGNLFGQSISATGNYYQMGQGTHKSRIELSFGEHPNSPTVIQLCDGRFVYKLQTSGKQRALEFVDLSRVRETAGEHANGITPTGWAASGGLASLFQHLASAFNFGEAEVIDGSQVVLRGSWASNALRQIAGIEEVADESLEAMSRRWANVPAQLPHAVEIVFSKENRQVYFPTQIKFLRFVWSEDAMEMKPMVELKFSQPELLADASDRYFVVESTDLDTIDMTDQYIARIDAFDELQQTAASQETMDR